LLLRAALFSNMPAFHDGPLRTARLLQMALGICLIGARFAHAQSAGMSSLWEPSSQPGEWVDLADNVVSQWPDPPAAGLLTSLWITEPQSDFDFVPEVVTFRGQSPVDLNSLSDEELIDLYVATYVDSLQQQSVDQSRLSAPGRLLVELGYSYGYDRDDLDFTYHQHTFPRLGLRYRISNRVELRAGWAGMTFDTIHDTVTGDSESDESILNPTFGARFLLWEQNGWVPQSALTVTTPFAVEGDHSFLGRFSPQVSLGYGYTIQNDWYLYGSTGAIWANEGGTRYLDLQQSVGVSWMFHDRWSASLDWYGLFPEGSRIGGLEHYLTPGLSYMLTPETLIGFDTSLGLNDNSPDVVATIRFLWQF
jgi:hypothetical protein